MNASATKKLPGKGFKRTWPPCGGEALLIKMDENVKAKVEKLLNGAT